MKVKFERDGGAPGSGTGHLSTKKEIHRSMGMPEDAERDHAYSWASQARKVPRKGSLLVTAMALGTHVTRLAPISWANCSLSRMPLMKDLFRARDIT